MTDPIFSGFLYSDTLLYLVCNVIWTQMRIKGTCVCMRVVSGFCTRPWEFTYFDPCTFPRLFIIWRFARHLSTMDDVHFLPHRGFLEWYDISRPWWGPPLLLYTFDVVATSHMWSLWRSIPSTVLQHRHCSGQYTSS